MLQISILSRVISSDLGAHISETKITSSSESVWNTKRTLFINGLSGTYTWDMLSTDNFMSDNAAKTTLSKFIYSTLLENHAS